MNKTIESFGEIEKEKIFSILDYDNENKKEENNELYEELNYKNYYILNVVEVENLIKKEVLIKILKFLRECKDLKINENFSEKEYQKNFYKFITEKNFI